VTFDADDLVILSTAVRICRLQNAFPSADVRAHADFLQMEIDQALALRGRAVPSVACDGGACREVGSDFLRDLP